MFEYINSILFKSKGPGTENLNENSDFQPYLVQRWCSMHSAEIAVLLNQTSNVSWSALQNNTMWFQYMTSTIPKCKFQRINYIKKKKDTETVKSQKEIINKVANNLEISTREVNSYIQEFNLQLPHEKK